MTATTSQKSNDLKMAIDPEDDQDLRPDVWAHLLVCLYNYKEEHEEQFAGPAGPEEEALRGALDAIERHALKLLSTGEIPSSLPEEVLEYQPWTPVEDKVLDLISYDLTQHRIEFEATEDVLERLKGMDRRIQIATLGFWIILGADPSPVSLKYYQRAAISYLAGFTTESVIMCGAVLEAALSTRFPDELLQEHGLKPRIRRTGEFTLGQRMELEFEQDHQMFEEKEREIFWEVVNARNNAVHTQPDLSPEPARSLLFTAKLLSVILPKGDYS